MIVWIAAYPRSGCTYFRSLLAAIFQLPSIGKKKFPMPQEAFFAAAAASPDREYIKTHELPRDDSYPTFCLVRDGRDVLVSHAWYVWQIGRKTAKDAIEPALYRRTLHNLIVTGANPRTGSWSENVAAWTRRPNTTIVRFEELIRNPYEVTVQATRHLGLGLTAVPDPVLPTFEAMHKQKPQFYRRGKVGSWQDEFPADLLPLFWKHHGAAMRELGYGAERRAAA
jgi:hypothetical protein